SPVRRLQVRTRTLTRKPWRRPEDRVASSLGLLPRPITLRSRSRHRDRTPITLWVADRFRLQPPGARSSHAAPPATSRYWQCSPYATRYARVSGGEAYPDKILCSRRCIALLSFHNFLARPWALPNLQLWKMRTLARGSEPPDRLISNSEVTRGS